MFNSQGGPVCYPDLSVTQATCLITFFQTTDFYCSLTLHMLNMGYITECSASPWFLLPICPLFTEDESIPSISQHHNHIVAFLCVTEYEQSSIFPRAFLCAAFCTSDPFLFIYSLPVETFNFSFTVCVDFCVYLFPSILFPLSTVSSFSIAPMLEHTRKLTVLAIN